eukprot:snap_masked-scaffold_13-processed-gene-5.28-mRNA-1 protein AED:1.00 eAED:1.00 QI:0/0/0/0/1/1/2/0/61
MKSKLGLREKAARGRKNQEKYNVLSIKENDLIHLLQEQTTELTLTLFKGIEHGRITRVLIW